MLGYHGLVEGISRMRKCAFRAKGRVRVRMNKLSIVSFTGKL